MIFEQPKHLNGIHFEKASAGMRLMMAWAALTLSFMTISTILMETKPGGPVRALSLLGVAAFTSLIFVMDGWVDRRKLRRQLACPRHLEVRPDGLFLSGVGLVHFDRLQWWSLRADNFHVGVTRLLISHQTDCWPMSLDNEDQISKLRSTLSKICNAHGLLEDKSDHEPKEIKRKWRVLFSYCCWAMPALLALSFCLLQGMTAAAVLLSIATGTAAAKGGIYSHFQLRKWERIRDTVTANRRDVLK